MTSAPTRRPAAAGLACLIAVLLVGLAVVAVHDLAVDRGWATGTGWVTAATDAARGTTASLGLAVVGALVALLGLTLVVLALAPARTTHLRASTDGDLWLTPAAVGALARTVADRSPGVLSAELTRVSRRRVVVEVATRDGVAVDPQVAAAVQDRLGGLTSARLDVRARTGGDR